MMTMPQKKAPVYIKDIRTGELVLVRIISSLPFYFKKFEGVELLPPDEVTGKPRKDAVIFHIEGIVDGVQLSSHRINLQQDKAEVDRPEEPVTKHIQGNFLMDKIKEPVSKCVQESSGEGEALRQEEKVSAGVQGNGTDDFYRAKNTEYEHQTSQTLVDSMPDVETTTKKENG